MLNLAEMFGSPQEVQGQCSGFGELCVLISKLCSVLILQ